MNNYFNTVPQGSPERYFWTPNLLSAIQKEVKENHNYQRFNEILRTLLKENSVHNFEKDCPDTCWKIYELLYTGYQDNQSVSKETAKKITESFAVKKVFANAKIPEDLEFICEGKSIFINKAVLILSNEFFSVMFGYQMRESTLSQIDYSKSLSVNSAIAIKNYFYTKCFHSLLDISELFEVHTFASMIDEKDLIEQTLFRIMDFIYGINVLYYTVIDLKNLFTLVRDSSIVDGTKYLLLKECFNLLYKKSNSHPEKGANYRFILDNIKCFSEEDKDVIEVDCCRKLLELNNLYYELTDNNKFIKIPIVYLLNKSPALFEHKAILSRTSTLLIDIDSNIEQLKSITKFPEEMKSKKVELFNGVKTLCLLDSLNHPLFELSISQYTFSYSTLYIPGDPVSKCQTISMHHAVDLPYKVVRPADFINFLAMTVKRKIKVHIKKEDLHFFMLTHKLYSFLVISDLEQALSGPLNFILTDNLLGTPSLKEAFKQRIISFSSSGKVKFQYTASESNDKGLIEFFSFEL